MSQLSYARYGKDNVRLYKVHRHEDGTQSVVEMTVRIMLEGDIETSYTRADNSVIVATDTQKQTTYILAKQNPITPPELFASILSEHFVKTYPHIHVAHVDIIQHRWTRLTVDGKPHPHSFMRDGEEKRIVEAVATEGEGITIRSGITDLLVLKSTGSAFHGFHRDEYTQLPETWDRILSTEIECGWHWKKFADVAEVKANVPKFDEAHEKIRNIILSTFANEDSASVQATMYNMSDEILATVPLVQKVDFSLPNKHYFEINLAWHNGLKNTGQDAEVYAPQSDPNGLIQCTVVRKKSQSKL